MADGDWKDRNQVQGLVNLLDAHTTIGATNGVWIDCGNYTSGFVIQTGMVGGDAINIDCSNGDAANGMAMPANTDHQSVFSTAVTSAAPFLSIPVLPRYLKAQVTAKAAGAAVTLALVVRTGRVL